MMNDTNQKIGTLIQIFTRAPVEGEVKTRLIPELGARGPCELHKRMSLHILNVATKVSPAIEIWSTPDIDHPFFTSLDSNPALKVQVGESLAERMASSLIHGLKKHKKVVLIGCDCPIIDEEILLRAFSLLDNHEYVFIPVEDGGFSLIGSVSFSSSIFQKVTWGSNLVMRQVRHNLKKNHYSWAELPTLWDVDQFADFKRLNQQMPSVTTDL